MCEISVIVPVFNCSRYIEKCIKSILRQSFSDFELLLIDDGSTDESGIICDRFSLQDERIKTFHNEHVGVSAARNYGIKQSMGTYICFIDSDDCIHRCFLEKLYFSLINNNSDMSVCNYYRIYDNGKRSLGLKPDAATKSIDEIIKNDILIVLWNKLFIKEKIKHLFDESISFCEDSLFCINYYLDNKAKISFERDGLYYYRCHSSGLTRAFQESTYIGTKKVLSYNLHMAQHIDNLKSKQQVVYHIYAEYFYGTYTFVFENIAKNPISMQSLDVIGRIINDKPYRRAVKYICRQHLINGKDFAMSKREITYVIGSIIKSKIIVLLSAKLRLVLSKENIKDNRYVQD